MAPIVATALTIAGVFGSIDLGKIVKEFDFSKIDVTDHEKKDYLHVGLAPFFGSLTAESIKKLDDKLKVMITGVTKSIGKIPPDARTWDKGVSALQQNQVIEPLDDGIYRSNKLIKEDWNFFKFDGSPDQKVVQEVMSWFVNLIGDEDVLNATKIDIGIMASIVAQTGAAVENFETLVYKRYFLSKTLLDIGVLIYPDIDHPFFKVYRIKLDAWADCSRLLAVQNDSNGISGEFSVRKYKPRESIIKALKKETHQRAVDEAEALFNCFMTPFGHNT